MKCTAICGNRNVSFTTATNSEVLYSTAKSRYICGNRNDRFYHCEKKTLPLRSFIPYCKVSICRDRNSGLLRKKMLPLRSFILHCKTSITRDRSDGFATNCCHCEVIYCTAISRNARGQNDDFTTTDLKLLPQISILHCKISIYGIEPTPGLHAKQTGKVYLRNLPLI